MRIAFTTIIAVLCLLAAGYGESEAQEMGSDLAATTGQHAQQFEIEIRKTVGCKYLLYLPKDYGKVEKTWPLMLFLHGAGERGDDLNQLKRHGPAKLVEQGKDMPFIIVSPQCPTGDWWPGKVETLKALVDRITDNYSVDTERVYLTGLSMGGYGSWAMGAAYPDTFAAAVPICGGGQPFSMARKLVTVPIWAFHGAKDSVVPLKESEQMVEAVRRAGGNAKLTVYPEANHDSWTATYDNPELYTWLLKHKKSKPKAKKEKAR